MKRFICFILSCVMICTILSNVPISVSAEAEEWLWPVENVYSMSRGYFSGHYGIDVTSSNIAGHEVLATKSGTVIESQNN